MFLFRKKSFTEKAFSSDEAFAALYPETIGKISGRHWSPLSVIKRSAAFVADEPGVRVLDIGSGTGKFCLGASFYKPDAKYYGVEQRGYLVTCAKGIAAQLGFANVQFIHANFTEVDFAAYDHFYFYNSFYENIVDADWIDKDVEYSREMYESYSKSLYQKLAPLPRGTRLATYHASGGEIPSAYRCFDSAVSNYLKFWVKEY